jgi:hypothetical protein
MLKAIDDVASGSATEIVCQTDGYLDGQFILTLARAHGEEMGQCGIKICPVFNEV